ncbi:unnamed protein product, partial [Durusdinium trenchii]
DCQRSCTQTPGCVAWTWVQDEGDDFQNCYRYPETGLVVKRFIPVINEYHYGIGIFACDTFAIYSSVSMELAPGVLTRRVTSRMATNVEPALG